MNAKCAFTRSFPARLRSTRLPAITRPGTRRPATLSYCLRICLPLGTEIGPWAARLLKLNWLSARLPHSTPPVGKPLPGPTGVAAVVQYLRFSPGNAGFLSAMLGDLRGQDDAAVAGIDPGAWPTVWT